MLRVFDARVFFMNIGIINIFTIYMSPGCPNFL